MDALGFIAVIKRGRGRVRVFLKIMKDEALMLFVVVQSLSRV